MATYDPSRYKKALGAIPLKITNIAPRKGSLLVGYAPYGLSALVATNMGGKSRILTALEAIPLEKLEPGMVSITTGEREARISLGTAELRVEEHMAAGKLRRKVSRTASQAEGGITPLPDPVEEMILGGELVDPEARWRRRLKGLLAWHPLQVTEERLGELAGMPMDPPHDDLLTWLVNAHAGKPFGSLLDAADALGGARGELNKRAKETEQEAEAAGLLCAEKEGALRQVLKTATQRAGLDPEEPEAARGLLDDSVDPVIAAVSVREAELAFARLEVAVEARKREEADRMALRDDHDGSPPDVAGAERALAEAVAAESSVKAEAAAKQQEHREAAARGGAFEAQLKEQLSEAVIPSEALAKIEVEMASRNRSVARLAHLAADLRDGAQSLLAAFKGGFETERRLLAIKEECERLTDEMEAFEPRLAAGKALRLGAEGALTRARATAASWQAVSDRLAAPIAGPKPEDLDEAAAVLAAARKASELASAGAVYRQAREALADQQCERERLDDLAKILREEVKQVWHRLGDVITAALQSSIVRISEGRIEVLHDDGRWLDVDDPERLSAGRLRRAFLDFYLERCAPGQNVVVDERIMLLIDDDGRREINARAAKKKMRLFFELPAGAAEAPEPQLLWYGNAAAQDRAEEEAGSQEDLATTAVDHGVVGGS